MSTLEDSQYLEIHVFMWDKLPNSDQLEIGIISSNIISRICLVDRTMKLEVGRHADFCVVFCIALILHNYNDSIFMFTASKQGMGVHQPD